MGRCDDEGGNQWICHVCDMKARGECRACERCYKTTCSSHLRSVPVYNPESGLYEMQQLCLFCASPELH